jgi:hypothetical protein
VSKHIQTAAHSAKEAESGDSRGTDYADATPAGSIAANVKMARAILLFETNLSGNNSKTHRGDAETQRISWENSECPGIHNDSFSGVEVV